MKLNKIIFLVLIGGLLSSCRGESDVYEVFNNDLATLAERAKWRYENFGIGSSVSLYEKSGDVYLVSFSIVASCQKDSLQNRLSKERAVCCAEETLYILSECQKWEVFDADKDFSLDTNPFDKNNSINDFQDDDYVEVQDQPSNWYSLDIPSIMNNIPDANSIMLDMQPLMRFSGEYGEMVYGYYLLLPWFKTIANPLNEE